jgi:transcriptional regulator with XRE-family HTH domain
MPPSASPAASARIKAGLTLEEVSSKTSLSVGYLRQLEREGFPLHRARQMARLYGTNDLGAFLPQKGDRTLRQRNRRNSLPQKQTNADYVSADNVGISEEEMEEAYGETDYRGHGGEKLWTLDEYEPEDE